MKVPLLVLTLFAAFPATADFAVVEDTQEMTVYRDGDHVIVLVGTDRPLKLQGFAMARSPEVPWPTPIWDKESRRAGVKTFLSRMRILDGELVCEKFAVRPDPEFRDYVVAQIAMRPCRTGLL